jgi:hypothetical protein
MNAHVACTTMIGLTVIAVAGAARAPQAPVEVTFAVPLNLTRLPSNVPKVRVRCELNSGAFADSANTALVRPYQRTVQKEITVSQGDAVQTAHLVITIQPGELDNPSGKQATYECELRAFDATQQAWVFFGARSSQSHVELTPTPAPITGAFVW